jgi:hypothetical protein
VWLTKLPVKKSFFCDIVREWWKYWRLGNESGMHDDKQG